MITKKLLDVCDFQGGTQPPKDEWVNDPREGYVRMLQIRDYSQGDAKFIQYVKDTKKLHKCKKDDIMLSRYGYIGQAFMGLEGAYNVALVKVIKKEEIYTPYLLYYFQSYYFQHFLLSNVGARATIPGFNKEELENALIKIPEMSEQLEIASKIAKVDELIGFHKQQLDVLDSLIKSRFIEMFGDPIANEKGWSMHPLEDVCKTIVDCPHSTPNYTNEDTGYMCIRTSIVKKNRILWDDIEYISQAEYQQRIQRKRPEKGDIVYTREGAILGIAAVIDRDCNVALGQRSMLLSPNTGKCLPHFLSVAMNFDSFLNKALGGISGSASPHINVGDIKAFSIILPPIELQRQYVELIEQTDKSKFEIQQSLEKLEILKKSLMQQYFG